MYEDSQFSEGPALPSPRLAVGAIEISPGEVLVYGGYHTWSRDTAHIYNFGTGVWTSVGKCPSRTYTSNAVLIKDREGEDLVFMNGNGTFSRTLQSVQNRRSSKLIP